MAYQEKPDVQCLLSFTQGSTVVLFQLLATFTKSPYLANLWQVREHYYGKNVGFLEAQQAPKAWPRGTKKKKNLTFSLPKGLKPVL